MKLTTGILAITISMVAGGAVATNAAAQNPDAIDNARSIAKSLQQKQANDTNAALSAAGVGQASKPAPGAPAPAIKPAVIPVSASTAKPVAASKPAPAAASAHNQLRHVEVVPAGDSIRIEISSSEAVTPRVSKLSGPARILVELPETVIASAKTKIPVEDGGVKGVRLGMDGKTPPTTSVVVDLDKAVAFDLTPGPADKLVLTLHTGATQTAEKKAPAPAKAAAAAPQKQTIAKAAPPAAKTETARKETPKKEAAEKPAAKTVIAKAEPERKPASPAPAASSVKAAAPAPSAAADVDPTKTADTAKPKPEEKKWAMNGKRDPFFSPVVQQPSGSGCSTGKKCLEIGNINLRGVVKSDSGFIAVVTNSLNKAYFLRENDPVFNGYVVKITGDSVVFSETVEDKLGKPFTREVVKRIFTPAV
ncbi:MAG TPA: AMIN domain-containing protein [Verrucomicrobiae bacterium]|nr:AMIN domain-containing protein [Verrucomicrobiae bacterium]